ncbi:MAG: YpdA family putative bacillithiol disulfide reductase [Bryobacteraceae bacterium]|nr:YpdA family putative bacillithiol disulfide reductase [Bryobacteraceae bacterium]
MSTQPKNSERADLWDAIVIGAGPTGLACAIELKKRGLRAFCIEKGCLCNSLANYPSNMVFFTTPELLEIGDLPMTSLGDKPTRIEGLKYYRRVAAHYSLDIHQYETVQSVSGEDGDFRVVTRDHAQDRHAYRCRKVVLATGFYDIPNPIGCAGEDLPKVTHYYKEAHPYWQTDVAVIGAKNSAAIACLELFWTGARSVTLIHRGPAIHHNVKYWIKPNIENRIKAGEVKAYFNSSVSAIRAAEIDITTPDGMVTIPNDFVLAMTGYRPDLDFLGTMGITLQPATMKPVTDPVTLESARKGIYLAGVIVAGMHTNEIFIENGRFHGALIADSILSEVGALSAVSA